MYSILYTKQKTQKNKRWHDGTLKITNNKAILSDENGTFLDSIFLKSKSISVGDELDFEKCLVTVEDVKSAINQEDTLLPSSVPNPSPSLSKPFKSSPLSSSSSVPSQPQTTLNPRARSSGLSRRKTPGSSTSLPNTSINPLKNDDDDDDIHNNDNTHININRNEMSKTTKKSFVGPQLKDVTQPSRTVQFRIPPSISQPVCSNNLLLKSGPISKPLLQTTRDIQLSVPNDGRSVDDILRMLTDIPSPSSSHHTSTTSDHFSDFDYSNQSEEAASDEILNEPIDEPIIKPINEPLNELMEPVKTSSDGRKKRLGNQRQRINSVQLQNTTTPTTFTPPPKASLNTPPSKKRRALPSKDNIVKPTLIKLNPFDLDNWSKFLSCPDDKECTMIEAYHGSTIHRLVTIQNKFKSTEEYQTCLMEALVEEISINVQQLTLKLRHALYGLVAQKENNKAISCEHGVARLLTVHKSGRNKGRLYYSCPKREKNCLFQWANQSDLAKLQDFYKSHIQDFQINKPEETSLRHDGVDFYSNCEIFVSSGQDPNNNKTTDTKSTRQIYVKLSSKNPSASYSKDDLWIISSLPSFTKTSSADFLMIGRSTFHGIGRTGVFEVQPFDDFDLKGKSEGFYAIHGANISSELSMLDNLLHTNFKELPIATSLLGSYQNSIFNDEILPDAGSKVPILNNETRRFKLNILQSEIDEVVEQTLQDYPLNQDQIKVLRQCVNWLEGVDTPPAKSKDINLVHGVFGSGKSYMLVVIIICLCNIFKIAQTTEMRILISSATNVAVDRILEALLEQNFTDFIRVGSLKKIAKPILRYTLIHSERNQNTSDEQACKDSLRDLQDMLDNERLSKSEANDVLDMIQQLKSGAIKQRAQMLQQVPVVGVTCAASSFSVLDGNVFPIVIIDEASQMLEALSLLPITRFGCCKLIAVGDPKQLPPTIGTKMKTKEEGLGRTLFDRLVDLGNKPTILRTQYRCHPKVSLIANSLFYQNMLLDGVTEKDREPIVGSLPPILFINADRAHERTDSSGSYYNTLEIQIIAQLLKMFTQQGVEGSKIGVITLYRAQAQKIQEHIKSLRLGTPSPTTKKATSRPIGGTSLTTKIDPDQELDEFELTDDFTNDIKLDDEPEDEISQDSCDVEDIQISTVDAFQGAEKDIIILTTSRTTIGSGFFDSPNRLNVAITRAKRHLIVVGNQNVLLSDMTWKKMLSYVKELPGAIQSGVQLLMYECFSGALTNCFAEPKNHFDEPNQQSQ